LALLGAACAIKRGSKLLTFLMSASMPQKFGIEERDFFKERGELEVTQIYQWPNGRKILLEVPCWI